MAEFKKVEVDRQKIKTAIKAGIPLSLTTYTIPHEMEIYMDDILRVFLEELNQMQMCEQLTYCLNELMTNAKKANTKRVYFKTKNLKITEKSDYEIGMKTFKKEMLEELEYYLGLQKKAGLYVRVSLQYRDRKIKIEVRNNSEITIFEDKRVRDRLSRAKDCASIEDAFSQVLDDSEGAGLGLVILILMLQKIGFTGENFQAVCENGETIMRIILPLPENEQAQMNFISEEFANAIDELPQFPENITAINRLLNDPDSRISDIAMRISNDVALTAELLKTVNSAAFALPFQCRSVYDAVKFVGIHGIRNLLFSIGAIQSFGKFDDERFNIWKHSYQVAFYSFNIARNYFATKKNIIEDSYICGLLHDMGKIVFESSHPEFIARIKKNCETKNIPDQIFERLLAGVNHAEIGALIAEKWNFPDVIAKSIRFHHTPDLAEAEAKDLSAVVCLADLMAHYHAGEISFPQIDNSILDSFKFTNEMMFKKISDKLYSAFKES